MMKWSNDEITKWWNHDMIKWWYGSMIGMCQYSFGVKWCNDFFRFPNGEMLKPVYGVMVIWWNSPILNRFFGTHFHRWWNGEMANKINNTLNFMARFNCCMVYQLCFSLLDFRPERQWWPSWRVWGSSPILSLVSAGLPHIMSCHLSIFPDGEVV